MIIYTPMQLELVLEGLDNTCYPKYREIEYKGVSLVVEPLGDGRQKIIKLLSTNPFDYLIPELAPGSIINC